MRICIASSGLGHITRGIESWADDLGHALNKRGMNVTLCKGGGTSDAEFEHVLPCLTRYSRANARVMRLTPRALWRVGLTSCYDLEQLTFLPALLRHLRRHRSQILHVQDPLLALWVQRANRMGIVPTRVILNHGTNESPEFLRKIIYLQHGAPVHLDAARAAGCYRPTWCAIPNFIDIKTFRPGRCDAMREELGIPRAATLVLCVAAIKREHKRIDHLIREFAALRSANPNLPVYLVIAGGAEADTDELIAMGRAELGDRFIPLVRFPRQRIADLYRAADLFVLCSLREMMPMVLLEATASGLPCLVHSHPSVQWIVGSSGCSIDMSSVGVLAGAMRELCLDEQLRTQLGHEIRQHCEANFGLDSVVNRIVDHYRLVLADHAETSHAGAADAASISARKTAASLVGEPASVIASRL